MEPGPYIQTAGGRRFNPLDPDPGQVDVLDIARALSNQCRFGGNCRTFYSVAQHSCHVADLAAKSVTDPETHMWALLHDATEAYLVDLPHPLKHRSALGALYAEAEDRLEVAIATHFELKGTCPRLVKTIDRALLARERVLFSEVAWHWPELDGVEPADLDIAPWLPERAHDEFIAHYERIEALRGAHR